MIDDAGTDDAGTDDAGTDDAGTDETGTEPSEDDAGSDDPATDDAAAGDPDDSVSGDHHAAPVTPEERRALFRIVRGEPSDAEVAALAVVLAAAASAEDSSPTAAGDRWADPAARLRVPVRPGPGAWRASAWPR